MRPTRLTAIHLTAALGLALGAAVLAMPAPARAADDGEWADTKFLRSLLEGIGLRKDGDNGINYQERAPLVIPPRLELPPPDQSAAAVENNPAWPKDPDVARRREEARQEKNRNISEERELEQNPLRPNQMTPGRTAPRRAARDDGYRAPADGISNQVAPSALGFKGNLFGRMFGPGDDEVARFTGEPPRAQLTDPPAGYQTPSPDQPYGLSKDSKTSKPKALKLEDRVAGQ